MLQEFQYLDQLGFPLKLFLLFSKLFTYGKLQLFILTWKSHFGMNFVYEYLICSLWKQLSYKCQIWVLFNQWKLWFRPWVAIVECCINSIYVSFVYLLIILCLIVPKSFEWVNLEPKTDFVIPFMIRVSTSF